MGREGPIRPVPPELPLLRFPGPPKPAPPRCVEPDEPREKLPVRLAPLNERLDPPPLRPDVTPRLLLCELLLPPPPPLRPPPRPMSAPSDGLVGRSGALWLPSFPSYPTRHAVGMSLTCHPSGREPNWRLRREPPRYARSRAGRQPSPRASRRSPAASCPCEVPQSASSECPPHAAAPATTPQ